MRMSLRFACVAAGLVLSVASQAADDFSDAERALFMDNQLAGMNPPATLRYGYRKSGSLESGFDDSVTLTLGKQPDGSCCTAVAEFLTGERKVTLPEVEAAQGNPVILYFLERDIHEMQRLTKGQHNYFRKRIRMAVYQGASIRDVKVSYRGADVPAKEIAITPYVDDPLKARYEKLANKQYVFTLSSAVPGGVYAIHTRITGASPTDEPLIEEDLRVDGAPALPTRPR
jgi:hypothetical protein